MKCRGKSDLAGKDCCKCGLLMDNCEGHPDYAFDDYGGWKHMDELDKEDEMQAQMRNDVAERKKKMDELTEAARPLIKFLNENHHPHTRAIVDPTGVEVVEGIMSNPKIYDYMRD